MTLAQIAAELAKIDPENLKQVKREAWLQAKAEFTITIKAQRKQITKLQRQIERLSENNPLAEKERLLAQAKLEQALAQALDPDKLWRELGLDKTQIAYARKLKAQGVDVLVVNKEDGPKYSYIAETPSFPNSAPPARGKSTPSFEQCLEMNKHQS